MRKKWKATKLSPDLFPTSFCNRTVDSEHHTRWGHWLMAELQIWGAQQAFSGYCRVLISPKKSSNANNLYLTIHQPLLSIGQLHHIRLALEQISLFTKFVKWPLRELKPCEPGIAFLHNIQTLPFLKAISPDAELPHRRHSPLWFVLLQSKMWPRWSLTELGQSQTILPVPSAALTGF